MPPQMSRTPCGPASGMAARTAFSSSCKAVTMANLGLCASTAPIVYSLFGENEKRNFQFALHLPPAMNNLFGGRVCKRPTQSRDREGAVKQPLADARLR